MQLASEQQFPWSQGAEIDDLVALSLDLWATSGYQRLEPGLAGL